MVPTLPDTTSPQKSLPSPRNRFSVYNYFRFGRKTTQISPSKAVFLSSKLMHEVQVDGLTSLYMIVHQAGEISMKTHFLIFRKCRGALYKLRPKMKHRLFIFLTLLYSVFSLRVQTNPIVNTKYGTVLGEVSSLFLLSVGSDSKGDV